MESSVRRTVEFCVRRVSPVDYAADAPVPPALNTTTELLGAPG
jgi:hypothetical protein